MSYQYLKIVFVLTQSAPKLVREHRLREPTESPQRAAPPVDADASITPHDQRATPGGQYNFEK